MISRLLQALRLAKPSPPPPPIPNAASEPEAQLDLARVFAQANESRALVRALKIVVPLMDGPEAEQELALLISSRAAEAGKEPSELRIADLIDLLLKADEKVGA